MKQAIIAIWVILTCISTRIVLSQSMPGQSTTGYTFTTYKNGSVYELYDQARNIRTWALRPGNTNLNTDNNNTWTETSNPPDPPEEIDMVRAHYYAEVVYDYWKTVHSRLGYNNLNGSLIIYTNNGIGNGSWSAPKIYCSASGAQSLNGYTLNWSSYADLDIIAHEFTHAVIENTCGLEFDGAGGEAGALNEAICDFFSAAIKKHTYSYLSTNWIFGSSMLSVNGTSAALRYLNDPERSDVISTLWPIIPAGYPRAKKIGDTNWGAKNDHYCHAGPLTYALYLISEGGEGVEGITIDATAKIVYRALISGDLNSNSGYDQMKVALLNAATYLYGPSKEYVSIGKAFNYIYLLVAPTSTITHPFIVENNFGSDVQRTSGTVKIDGATGLSSGSSVVGCQEGTFHTIEAEDQFESNNQYFRLWNDQGVNTSNWSKQIENQLPGLLVGASKRIYGMQVTSTDGSYNIIYNDLKRRYNVFVNQQPEFDAINYGTVPAAQIVDQNSGPVTAPAQQLINGKTYQFSGWADGPTSISRIVSPTDNVTLTANYKGIHLSSNSAAWQNGSQRKFASTDDGNLHAVYESMGHVWYETSTNNGSTWSVANNGNSLDTYGGKLPAIDSHGNDIAIIWQENWSGAAALKIARFNSGGNMCTYYPLNAFVDVTTSFSQNLDPVIAYDYQGRVAIAWENKDNTVYPIGIAVAHGLLPTLYNNNPTWTTDYNAVISSTDINCINPTIAVAKNPVDQYNMMYHIAWQYIQSSSYSTINYCKATANTGGVTLSAVSSPSSGAGFWQNQIPSITAMNDNTVRLVWLGYTPWYLNRTVYRPTDVYGNWSSTVMNMGSSVTQPIVNSTNDGKFAIAWVQNSGGVLVNSLVTSDNIYGIKNITPVGSNLQLNNASSLGTMYSIPFQNQTAPYSFGSLSNVGSLQKDVTPSFGNGRGIVSVLHGKQYCIGVADIVADNVNIGFVSLDSLPKSLDKRTLGTFLRTRDFDINNNSKITCSIFQGIIDPKDSTNVVASFGDKDYIDIKIAIIDTRTEQLLAVIKNNKIAKGESASDAIASYSINTTGMGQRRVRFGFMVDDNVQPRYVINEFFSNGKSVNLLKSTNEDISLNSIKLITEYTLDQNFPNPFNPSTTISFQLPKASHVNLIVYDMLGREVATLISGEKQEGAYSATFDASRLGSGLYIGKLTAGDFTKTIKMVLLK
jgi:hypothetical protein